MRAISYVMRVGVVHALIDDVVFVVVEEESLKDQAAATVFYTSVGTQATGNQVIEPNGRRWKGDRD